jgi:thioredoxin 1
MLGFARHFRAHFAHSTLDLFLLRRTMENSAAITVNDSNFETEVTRSAQPVLVDFWAEWCGPCKMIAPILDEIAKEKAGTVKVAKVDVDNNQSLSARYNIRAIPTLLFFKDGQLRDQVTGMTSKKDLLNRLEALG